MSPQQAWLWGLQDGAAPGTYHAQCVAHISGPLDRARFDAALAATVARHELLRTALLRLTAMTVPLQVIGAEGRVALEFHDLTAAGADALHALVTAQRARCCAVDEGPVVLLALARLDADHHALIVDCPSLWADTQGLREPGNQPRIGHAILAIDPDALAGMASYYSRLEQMVSKMLAEEGVRLPGARRQQATAKSRAEGIEVSEALLSELRTLTRFKK